MSSLYTTAVLGHPLWRWLCALAVVALTFLLLSIAKRFAGSRLSRASKRTETVYDDVIVEALGATRGVALFLLAVLAGAASLDLPAEHRAWLGRAAIVVVAVQVGLWLSRIVKSLVESRRSGLDLPPEQRTMTAAAGFVTNFVVWGVLGIVVLSNFGVEVTTLVAGLGIGGVAAALAVQNVLGDLFAAFSIYVDRPFDIGDFVVVDAFMGTVEKISWRSTQLRSLGGELVVLANSDLARARLRNYKRMTERRVVLEFGVEYGTPAEKLAAIPEKVRTIVSETEGLRFDRSHFAKYGASSLDFESVFYVLSPDYNAFMDRQQRLLLALYTQFERDGIAFAFPTRTVHVKTPA